MAAAQQTENTNSSEQNNAALYSALQQLDERSQEILQARWLSDNKTTLQDLAEKYQISAERVRQLEKLAMQKIKENIEAA